MLRARALAGVAAIGLMGAVATSAIVGWGGRATTLSSGPDAPAGGSPPRAPPAPPAPGAPLRSPPHTAPSQPDSEEAAEAPELEVVTEERPGRFGVRGGAVTRALLPFGDRISACARGDRPRGVAGRLVLHLDRSADRVRVVRAEASREQNGAVEIERCAQAELVGREIDVPGVTPGPVTVLPLRIRP